MEALLKWLFNILERYGVITLFVLAIGVLVWFLVSKSKILKNRNILEIIPSLFPTFGILCTFAGVAYGLSEFDINDIDKSIPKLIDGLKTAFYASGLGIIFLIIANIIVSRYIANQEINLSEQKLDEQKFEMLSQNIVLLQEEISGLKKDIINAIKGENENSLAGEFVKTRELIKDLRDAIGSSNETSLLYQIQKLRDEQDKIQRETKDLFDKQLQTLSRISEKFNQLNNSLEHLNNNVKEIMKVQNENSSAIIEKLNEFSKQLAESNTKALVEAMEKVINDFNTQMKELIGRLVKENFEELNNSVKSLNDWQKENKAQIEALIKQFNEVKDNISETSKNFETISLHTKNIAKNTDEITNNDSKLNQILSALNEVMVEDEKFKEIVRNLNQSVNNINTSTGDFAKLIKQSEVLTQAMKDLIIKLQEIEKLKDINSEFWNQIKNNLENGIGIIEQGNKKLREEVGKLDNSFYERLDNTFRNLDKLMTSVGEKYLPNHKVK